MTKAYNELIDFIARGSDSEDVARYQPSPETKARAWDLVQREKSEGLSEEEKSELSYYVQLEHVLRMAKARAREVIQQRQGDAATQALVG